VVVPVVVLQQPTAAAMAAASSDASSFFFIYLKNESSLPRRKSALKRHPTPQNPGKHLKRVENYSLKQKFLRAKKEVAKIRKNQNFSFVSVSGFAFLQ
jgi:hypothetical protein